MKTTALLLVLFLMQSCIYKLSVDKKYNKFVEQTTIEKFMLEQELAWNNADLEGFMGHYWNSDSLSFIGSKGITRGWKSTLANYKKSYPDASAMGKLSFTNVKVDILDASNAFVIGKWQLDRSADTLSGHYTLLWKKINDTWQIVADHSS